MCSLNISLISQNYYRCNIHKRLRLWMGNTVPVQEISWYKISIGNIQLDYKDWLTGRYYKHSWWISNLTSQIDHSSWILLLYYIVLAVSLYLWYLSLTLLYFVYNSLYILSIYIFFLTTSHNHSYYHYL